MTKKEVSYFFDVYGPFSVKRDKGSCTSTEFVYRHNSLVGHALLRGRMHDELQHDFRSADRGRAWRRNRWRRSLTATLRRGHWRDPPGIARPPGHFLSRPASDPGAASCLRPPV